MRLRDPRREAVRRACAIGSMNQRLNPKVVFRLKPENALEIPLGAS
jgi:hypothetical protein